VLQHHQVGGELVEVATVPAAAYISLDARLEPVVEAIAVLGRHGSDAR